MPSFEGTFDLLLLKTLWVVFEMEYAADGFFVCGDWASGDIADVALGPGKIAG